MSAVEPNPFIEEDVARANAVVQESIAEILRLWSVTTLIRHGLPTSEGLIRWRLNQVAETAIEKRETLAMRLESDGREETVKWLADASDRRSRRAMTRGTEIHAIVEKLSLGIETGPVPGELVPYIEQLQRWEAKWQPEPLMAEAPVYNVTHRYAGTLDGVQRIRGRTVVIDYKTTDKPPDARSRPPYPEVALQLCAYRRAELVGVLSEQRYAQGKRYYLFDPTQQHEPMPAVDGALCIVISPYDCFAVAVRTDDVIWRTFRALQATAAWDISGNQEALGAVLDAHEPTA